MSRGVAKEDCILLDKLIFDFKSSNWAWLFVILFIYLMSCIFRTWRWQMLIRPLGYSPTFKNGFMAIMIGYFANLGMPRLGEVLRAGLYSKYDAVPLDKVFGTIVTDRIVDIICLFVFLVVTAPFAFGPVIEYVRTNQTIDSALMDLNFGLLGISALVVIVFFIRVVRSSFFQNSAIYKKLKSFVMGFKDGVMSIFSLERPFIFIMHSIGIWICYYLMTYLTFNAFEPTAHLGPREGLITFIFGTLGILFPSPGGMGSYHFMVMEALSIFRIDSLESFSFANIIYFAIMVFGNVVFGILSLIFMPLFNKK